MPARIVDIEQLAAQQAVSRCAKGPVVPRCARERAVRSPRSRARVGSAWLFSAVAYSSKSMKEQKEQKMKKYEFPLSLRYLILSPLLDSMNIFLF
jgi:hypothetical protein